MRNFLVKIKRYNPELDDKPHWEDYRVEADPADRVLDVLLRIKWHQDGTLALRYSCAHGVCGSDAMRINGFNSLSCKVLVKTLESDTLTIEPMMALPVIKDLIVDMKPFFDSYKSVMPFLAGACPRGIQITKAIIEVQLALLTGSTEGGETTRVVGGDRQRRAAPLTGTAEADGGIVPNA
jgi:succinate dehydrogenase/fumarate reductase iron-sulfur protein